MPKQLLASLLCIGLVFTSCKDVSPKQNLTKQEVRFQTTDSIPVYKTEHLVLKKLAKHTYQHISYLDTDSFGKVACNGMFVLNESKAVVFDTPTDDKSSMELIRFITHELKSEIIAIVPTHFHEDCVGGISQFEANHIQTYATKQTTALLLENGQNFKKPVKEFDTSLTLTLGDKKVHATYFGEGHTEDNIIGYFPEDHTMFGGCLLKATGASKGFLGDANTEQWSETVHKIKVKYPKVDIVIPGHGKAGGTDLFDYTINLFATK